MSEYAQSFDRLDGDAIDWSTARTADKCGSGLCVEVGYGPDLVGIQDTKEAGMLDTDRSRVIVSAGAFALFLHDVKLGAFDIA